MPESPGVFRPDETYTVAEFRRRAGLGDFSFRQARRDGLRVVSVGKKLFVRGRDWADYIDRKAAEDDSE